MARATAEQFEVNGPASDEDAAAKRSVFGHERSQVQPIVAAPAPYALDARNRSDGRVFLDALPAASFPIGFFDPQYRGVLDRQRYGNEGARQKDRAELEQMDEETIRDFIRKIARALMPSGHLFLWIDKFHLCTGVGHWLEGADLNMVDLITWNKQRIGMGYRTRRTGEHCMVLQKAPLRAKGVWLRHDIPDVWDEKVDRRMPHIKPVGLQKALIEAVSNPGDVVLDPAAGCYSVLEAARLCGRRFLGCDLRG